MRNAKKILAVVLTLSVFMSVITSGTAAELGTVETMLSQIGCLYEACDLGTATAAAIRSAAGTDFAAVSGGLLYQNIAGGSATEESIAQSYTNDEEIYICTLTALELKEMIEVGISHIVVGADEAVDTEASAWEGFLQVSGLTVKCDYSAAAGDRVMWIKGADGEQLDLTDETTVYTLAVTGSLLQEEYGYPVLTAEKYDDSMLDIVYAAVAEGTLSADETPYKIISVQGTILMQKVSPLIPVLLTVMFLIVGALSTSRANEAKRRKEAYEADGL